MRRALVQRAGLAALALLGGGCASNPLLDEAPGRTDERAACRDLFAGLDAAAARHDVRDTQAARIEGFPYLRVSRFLVSFADEVDGGARFDAWVDRLMALDRAGRRVELANLPAEARAPLARAQRRRFPDEPDLAAAVVHCGPVLRRADLADPAGRERLRRAAEVADEYVTWQRVIGAYYLTAVPFLWGVGDWHEESREVHARGPEGPPLEGRLVRYRPRERTAPEADEVARILRRAARNPLDIPEPGREQRARLLAAFAPILEVDTATVDDHVGAPFWPPGGDRPGVETSRPVAYRYVSHTRFDGEVLLQLGYVFWFPARPRTSAFDLLGGHIDGLVWRVTLAPDGRPLLYDSMHNCGCFHTFYPTERLAPRPTDFYEESPLIPAEALDRNTQHPAVLRLAHRTHYLQYVAREPRPEGAERRYAERPYAVLRSLPGPQDGRRSLFRPDGIVPGTARRERLLFWPMGVPHPGAMRQRGHHATAFVGRRHFDDPFLIERLFAPPGEASPGP